jgi:tRNA(Ile2) C34 agmatinyltransferase TiaS
MTTIVETIIGCLLFFMVPDYFTRRGPKCDCGTRMTEVYGWDRWECRRCSYKNN